MPWAIKNVRDNCMTISGKDKNWCVFDSKQDADDYYSDIPESQKSYCKVVKVDISIKVLD